MYCQGDIVEVSFSPSVGHETQKKRPALVLGCDRFSHMSNLQIIAPITSVDNKYPLHVEIKPGNVVQGFVCLEQMSALNLYNRQGTTLGSMDQATMTRVLDIIRSIFDI